MKGNKIELCFSIWDSQDYVDTEAQKYSNSVGREVNCFRCDRFFKVSPVSDKEREE